MTPPVLFFLFRIGSALLLLAFLGLIAWFLYQDLRQARTPQTGRALGLGVLRVLSAPADEQITTPVFELSPITTIGRNSRNTIVLDGRYVSGDHALLTWRDSQWWLEDLGSRNGIMLNDAPLGDPAVISVGDIFDIGGFRFKLEMPGHNGQGQGTSF